MPLEVARKRHSLKIPVPGRESDLAWYIWVNDEISFQREDGYGQEIRLSMDNTTANESRTVHTVEIDAGASTKLKVERIDTVNTQEDQGIGQEAIMQLLNSDTPPSHLQTHKVTINSRYQSGKEDNGYQLVIQKIDEIYVKEDQGIGQETYWSLNNVDDENKIVFADPDAVYDKDRGPIRLDWFQNIIDSPPNKMMMVLYGDNQIASFPMATISNPKSPTKKTVYGTFGTPPDWFASDCGPAYYQVAQIKPSNTVTPMATQLDFSSKSIKAPRHWYQQYVYNLSATLFSNAAACTPLTQTNSVLIWQDPEVSLGQIYGWHWDSATALPPYNACNENIAVHTNSSTWDVFGLGIFYERRPAFINGDPPTTRWETVAINDCPWWVYSFPLINVSPSGTIYNERGDSFTTSSKGIALDEAGDMTTFSVYGFNALTGQFYVGELPSNDYPHTLAVDEDGTLHDPWQFRSVLDTTITIRKTTWTQKDGLDVYSSVDADISGADFKAGRDYPVVYSISFPYNVSDDLTKRWALLDDGPAEDSGDSEPDRMVSNYAKYPLQYNWVITPYGKFAAQADGYAFQGWLHLSNGEHILQGFIIRSDPSTWKRYIYLDGKEYGSKLAAAIGCSIDDIRAIYFDIKQAEISSLR
jgi:hypothetical protein